MPLSIGHERSLNGLMSIKNSQQIQIEHQWEILDQHVRQHSSPLSSNEGIYFGRMVFHPSSRVPQTNRIKVVLAAHGGPVNFNYQSMYLSTNASALTHAHSDLAHVLIRFTILLIVYKNGLCTFLALY